MSKKSATTSLHSKSSAKFEVKEDAYYNEQQILKVWDVYIKTKGLKYWFGNTKEGTSIFADATSMNIAERSGLLLNDDGTLFVNESRKTVSISGPVDYMSNANLLDGYNGITNDINVALDQVKAWNLAHPEGKIASHIIIFPYHITVAHWGLGVLSLNFDEQQAAGMQTIELYNPLPECGDTKISDQVKEEILTSIRARFEAPNITLDNPEKNYPKQQNDGTSCGVISAENGKDFIDGGTDQRRINATPYPYGAKAVREQHLVEVSSERFTEMQLHNEEWNDHKFIPPGNIRDIARALYKGMADSGEDLDSSLQQLEEGGGERAQFIRNIIADHPENFNNIEIEPGKNINLSNTLFNLNSSRLEFKYETVDILKLVTNHIKVDKTEANPKLPELLDSNESSNGDANVDSSNEQNNLQRARGTRVTSQFSKNLEKVFGKEIYWKDIVLSNHGFEFINRLSGRFTEHLKGQFCHSYPLPGIAITGVIKSIKTMSVKDDDEQIGGDYFTFIIHLKTKLISSSTNAQTTYKEQLTTLNSILESTDFNDLEQSKAKVIKIYRDFMQYQTSYADIEYEGKVLSAHLGIHVIVNCLNDKGNDSVPQSLGVSINSERPTVILHQTQGVKGRLFVLHQVGEDPIPHSILQDSNCLFDSFAQAFLELYIQASQYDTEDTRAQRKASQKHYGIKLGLIPRESILNDLTSNKDLVRQRTAEILRKWDEALNAEELAMLRKLAQYDTYQTVRIAAAEALYLKGDESDRLESKQVIQKLLTYPGSGNHAQEGADLVRMRAAEAITYLQQNKGVDVDSECIELLRNLARQDSYQTVRIAAAETLYLKGTKSDRLESKQVIHKLLTYPGSGNPPQEGADLVRKRAIEAVVVIQDLEPRTIILLKIASVGLFDNIKVAAKESLSKLRQIKNKPWTIAIDPDTGTKYGTNGEVMLAIRLQPLELLPYIAHHQSLLQYQNAPNINFIQFIQKVIASGTKEYPNKSSVAFLQALEYGWLRYYDLPLSESAKFMTSFSLIDKTTPTLSLYNILLSDFISKNPQGTWRSHQKDYIHFAKMVECHKTVKAAIEQKKDLKQKTAIEETMKTVIYNLYRALQAFKDHKLLETVDFTEEEKKFMTAVQFITPIEAERFRCAFLGKSERDIYHVKAALNEERRTLDNVERIGKIQAKVTLEPYLEKYAQDSQEKLCDEHIGKLKKANARYTKAEAAISFLINLRDTILGKEGSERQMLGIGFHGSFFNAESDSFSDEAAVHLCFTEKYRIAGSVFLEYVGYALRDVLSKEFNTNIHVRVSSHSELSQKLMCHYTMDYIWAQMVKNSDNINEKLVKKINLLINQGLQNIYKSGEQDRLAAYLNLSTDVTLKNKLTGLMKQELPIESSDIEPSNILKLGTYILNQKMYLCVEMHLIPLLNSGWIFPIILPPVTAEDKLVSFKLNPWKFAGFDTTYTFFVAKPCEKCQTASTAYDIIAEIQSHFAEVRGFLGTTFPIWQDQEGTIGFSASERPIVKEINSKNKACIDKHLREYKEARSVIIQDTSVAVKDPNIDVIIDKKTGYAPLHKAIDEGDMVGVKDAISKGANVNLTINSGRTPLHIATCKGHEHIITELLKEKANANISDKKGYTSLHVAAFYGHTNIIQLLLANMSKKTITATDKAGKTAINLAEDKGDKYIVDLINNTIQSLDKSNDKPLNKDQELEITGNGLTVHEETSYWYEYSKVAMEKMLDLRLKSEGIDIDHARIIHPRYIFNEVNSSNFVKDLVTKISTINMAESENAIKSILLIPTNINNQHWVAMSVKFAAGKIIATYMDSEGTFMPKFLSEGLKAELAKSYPNSTIEIVEKEVEQQKYNNCGLEVIENLIAAVAGEAARIDQKDVLEAHSILYEQSLILEEAWRAKALQEEKAKHENETGRKASEKSTKHPKTVETVKVDKEAKVESNNVIAQTNSVATDTDLMKTDVKQESSAVLMEEACPQTKKQLNTEVLVIEQKKEAINSSQQSSIGQELSKMSMDEEWKKVQKANAKDMATEAMDQVWEDTQNSNTNGLGQWLSMPKQEEEALKEELESMDAVWGQSQVHGTGSMLKLPKTTYPKEAVREASTLATQSSDRPIEQQSVELKKSQSHIGQQTQGAPSDEAPKVPTDMGETLWKSAVQCLRMAMYVDRYDLSDVLHSRLLADGCAVPSRSNYSPELREILPQNQSANRYDATKQPALLSFSNLLDEAQSDSKRNVASFELKPLDNTLSDIPLSAFCSMAGGNTRGESWLQQFEVKEVDLSGKAND